MILPQRIDFNSLIFQSVKITHGSARVVYIRLSFIEALKIEILLQYQIIGSMVMMQMNETSIPKRMIIVSVCIYQFTISCCDIVLACSPIYLQYLH